MRQYLHQARVSGDGQYRRPWTGVLGTMFMYSGR